MVVFGVICIARRLVPTVGIWLSLGIWEMMIVENPLQFGMSAGEIMKFSLRNSFQMASYVGDYSDDGDFK